MFNCVFIRFKQKNLLWSCRSGIPTQLSLAYNQILLKITFFEEMTDFDIFFRDWKQCCSIFRNSLQDWQKIEPIRYRNYIKRKNRINWINYVCWKKAWWRKWQQTRKVTLNLFQIEFFWFLHFQKVISLLV